MNIKLQKWGNSTAIRLPKALLAEAGFREGFECKIHLGKKGIWLTPIKAKVKKKKEPTLEEMCALITPENRHPEFDWGGKPVGREIW